MKIEFTYADKPDEVWRAVQLPDGRFALSPCNPEAIQTAKLNEITEDLTAYFNNGTTDTTQA